MEIKVGDKVRVSKDAPKLLFTRSICNYPEYVFEVRVIEDDLADIYYGTGKIPLAAFVVPTKYLTKVEDEAKEPKFKVGDKVRKKKWDKDTTISYVEWHGTWQTYVYRFAEQEYGFNCHKEEDITLVSRRAKEPKFKTGDCVKISFEWNDLPIREKLVIKRLETIDCRDAYMYSIEGYGGCVIESMLHPYTKPTEQTETEEVARIRQLEAKLDEFRKAELDRVLHPEKYHTYEVTIDNVAVDWQRYEADLAHDLALKVANKHNDPKEAAGYAVSVAKAVVENLKKK